VVNRIKKVSNQEVVNTYEPAKEFGMHEQKNIEGPHQPLPKINEEADGEDTDPSHKKIMTTN